MSTRIVLALALAASLGCATTQEKQEAAPPPQLLAQELDVVQDVSSVTLELRGQLQAQAAATLERATWELVVDGEVVKSGEAALNLELPAGQATPFSFSARSQYVSSPEELRAMSERGGSLLAAMRGKLHVREGGATHQLDFARGREVRTPRLPAVKLQELDAARYSDAEANILFHLGVQNPNPFYLEVHQLQYKVEIAGKQVAEGARARGDKVTPAATGVYEVQVPVDQNTVGPEVKALIKSQLIPWVITGELKGDLYSVPFKLDGAVKLNVSK